MGGGDDGVCQTYAKARGGDGSKESIRVSPFSSEIVWYGEQIRLLLVVKYSGLAKKWLERLVQ